MAAADELRRFAAGHRLVIVSLTELIEWRSEQENDVRHRANTAIVERPQPQTKRREYDLWRPDRRVTT